MSSLSTKPRRPEGWVATGPRPRGDDTSPEWQPAPDEDLSYLAGDWRIFQPKSGHRWSLDDLVTAYVAVTEGGEEPSLAVDLGCGLGSVLMLVAWAHPACRVIGFEAQAARAERARRSLAYNGADARCRVVDGDIRDVAALVSHVPERARLITGTPPYFDVAATNLSRNDEAAACRAEVRGGLEVYMGAGEQLLAPGGSLVLCYPHSSGERAVMAASERQLALASRLTVIPASGKRPLIVVDRFVRAVDELAGAVHRDIVVRDESGRWTEEFRAVRRLFGMPDRPPAARDATADV